MSRRDYLWQHEEVHNPEIEVEVAMAIKTGKETGYDGIAPELIKYGGAEMGKQLTKLFQRVWEENKIPEEWKKNVIIPLHKKGSSYD